MQPVLNNETGVRNLSSEIRMYACNPSSRMRGGVGCVQPVFRCVWVQPCSTMRVCVCVQTVFKSKVC